MPSKTYKLYECLKLVLDRSEKLRNSNNQGLIENFDDWVAALEEKVNDKLEVKRKLDTKDEYLLINYLYWFLEKIKCMPTPLAMAPLDRSYFDACHKLLKELHDLDVHEQKEQEKNFYNRFCELEAKRSIAIFLLLIKDFIEKKLIAVSLSKTMQSVLNSVNDLLSDTFKPSKISELLPYCMAFIAKEEINKSKDSTQVNFFEEASEIFNHMRLDASRNPSFSSDNYPKFKELSELVEKFSKFTDRQTKFETAIETFFQLSDACANHPIWSKTTKKLGVPDGIESHKRCLSARHTHSQALVLQDLHQKTFERWRLFPASRHPITDYYYDQHYQLTKQLSGFLVTDGENLEFKRWLTEEDLKQVNEIIAQMEGLRDKTIRDLSILVGDSCFVPNVPCKPKRDDQTRTVVTYNVQQLLTSYYPKERASHLVNYLLKEAAEANGVDVFVLEEFFLPCALEILEKSRLAKDYHIIKPEGGDLLNSGVCILLKKSEFSDFKITKIPFSFATSVDQLTPKGFTHIEVTDTEGAKSHIVGTHTQAQYTGSEQQIIATFAQLAELAEYLGKIPKDEPLILAGDLNIPKRYPPTAIDSELLEYLIYPYSVHPVKVNTYDPQSNFLAKKLYPNAEACILDYGISRGYAISEGQVLTDTKYNHSKEIREISDHYPVKFTLKAKNSEPDSPLTVEEKQRRILAKLLRVAFQEASETNLLGQWKTGRAKEIYFSVCKLIKHYEDYTQKKELGTGSDFLNYCLKYNDRKEFTSFFEKTKQDKYNPLGALINYRLLKGPYADLTLEVFGQDDIFNKIIKPALQNIKKMVDNTDWDKKGRDLFFRSSKCPDGINRIRLYLTNIEFLNENKTEMLKTVFMLHNLLFDKLAGSDGVKASWYRDKETLDVYKNLLILCKGLIWFFPKSPQGITNKEWTLTSLNDSLNNEGLKINVNKQAVPIANSQY